MKTLKALILSSVMVLCTIITATAMDTQQKVDYCLPEATIAYDSIVNKNVGMLPEDQIHFFSPNYDGSIRFGKVVLGAYLWTGGPHSYAHIVFAECIQNTTYTYDR